MNPAPFVHSALAMTRHLKRRVPLICPTCQVLAQSVLTGDRLLLCMGLFSIFLVGGLSQARRAKVVEHGLLALADLVPGPPDSKSTSSRATNPNHP